MERTRRSRVDYIKISDVIAFDSIRAPDLCFKLHGRLLYFTLLLY